MEAHEEPAHDQANDQRCDKMAFHLGTGFNSFPLTQVDSETEPPNRSRTYRGH
jgi:hypothetical protein